MNISEKVQALKPSAIHEMTRLSKQYDDVAFLSWAKPASGTPEHINEAAINAIQNGLVSGYSQSDGLPVLRELIAQKLIHDNKIDAKAEEVLVTIGAIEALAASVTAVIDPGDEVILLTPTYSTHITQVKLASGIPVLIETDEENNYKPDIDKIESSVGAKTKAVILCTPNNPTGTLYSEEDLRAIAEIAVKYDLFVIVDEAYEYFIFDDQKHFSIASIPGMKNRVISVFTFTKTYAMTGWRIGYLHTSEAILSQIKKVHIPYVICVPVVSQYAAIAALSGDQKCVEDFRNKYLNARDLMCERMDQLKDFMTYVKPSGSYLMFPKIHDKRAEDSFDFAKLILDKAKVSATPGVAFGPGGESHLRFSFCVPEEMINIAFDRIEDFFKRS
jgi:aminotransferase